MPPSMPPSLADGAAASPGGAGATGPAGPAGAPVLPDGAAEGSGDPDGAVGVGTGGVRQSHGGRFARRVRSGDTRAGRGCNEVAGAASRRMPVRGRPVVAGAGPALRGVPGGAVPVAGAAGGRFLGRLELAGTVPMLALPLGSAWSTGAGRSSPACGAASGTTPRGGLKTLVATRYDAPDPSSASRQNAVIAANRRSGRSPARGGDGRGPGNVFSPVPVTSGWPDPAAAGPGARRSRS